MPPVVGPACSNGETELLSRNLFASESDIPIWATLLWYATGLACVLALGLSTLYFPFGPDQATILYGAEQLDNGARLYLEYWDNKQPGLYWFYWLAGRLFGFSEQGIRSLELVWLLAFSGLLMLTLRRFLYRPYLSALAPVVCVATYYATAREYELTQLEILVSLPIYIGIWAVLNAEKRGATVFTWWFLSGIAAGITVTFKLLLAPVFIVIWVWGLWGWWRHTSAGDKSLLREMLLRRLLPAGLGGLLVILMVAGWFAYQGTLNEMLWTSFIYPPEALLITPSASLSRLVTAAAFYSKYLIVWIPFALFIVVRLFLGKAPRHVGLLLLVLFTTVGLFLVQGFSWWQYHTLLFWLPTGLLAVMGLDQTLELLISTEREKELPSGKEKNRRKAWLAVVIALPLLGSLYPPLALRTEKLLHHVLVSRQGLHGFQWEMGEQYQRHWQGTEFLRRIDAIKGPIYVFGHPVVYRFSQREVPHAIVGSSWEFYLPAQIEDILQTLDTRRVPYILVDKNDYKLYRLNPTISIFLDTHYRPLVENESGRWYIHATLADQR